MYITEVLPSMWISEVTTYIAPVGRETMRVNEGLPREGRKYVSLHEEKVGYLLAQSSSRETTAVCERILDGCRTETCTTAYDTLSEGKRNNKMNIPYCCMHIVYMGHGDHRFLFLSFPGQTEAIDRVASKGRHQNNRFQNNFK